MFEQIEALLSHIRSSWRFRWKALLVMWAVAVVGWLGVFMIPSEYESSARIFVDTNSLLRPLLEGIAVSSNTENQLDLVRRALLGRPQLERVIANTDLSKRVNNERDREDLVRDLTHDIRITADVAAGQGNAGANVYGIAYMDEDRRLAYTVVRTLLDSFVEQSLGANRTDADAAQKFLRGQISDYERRLTDSETRLADFKKRNVGAMPDERGGYFERLQSEMSALDQVQASLTIAVHKRDELRGKLLGGAGSGSGVAGSEIVETSVDGRIKEANTRLEELLLRFTDQHPDVLSLRETITRLEQQRREELATLRQNTGSLGSPRASTSLVAQNLQIALNQTELDVAALQTQVRDRHKRVAELRAQINTLPGVEAELLRLNRDYNVTKTEYERLLQRLESAKLSDAADRVDEVRFKIIDPPVEAIVPARPKRVILLLGVLLAAIGTGGGFAWLMSQLRPVFVKPKDLSVFGDVPVFGTLNTLASQTGRMLARKQMLVIVAAFALLLVGAALLIAVHPALEAASHALMGSKGGA